MTKSIGRSFRIVLLCTAALTCLTLSFNQRVMADQCGIDEDAYYTECLSCCQDQQYCTAACVSCIDEYGPTYGGAVFNPSDNYSCYPPE
jgi:hypothetical protein